MKLHQRCYALLISCLLSGTPLLCCAQVSALPLAPSPLQPSPLTQPVPAVDESVIKKELAIRQQLLQQDPERLASAPLLIKKTTEDAQHLIEQNDSKGALARLTQIDPALALEDIPSVEVQMELAFIAHHDKDSDKETLYLSRASALAEILHHRIGSGSTPDDPVRVDSAYEMSDWAKSAGGTLSNLKTLATTHGEVLQGTFQRAAAVSPEEPVFFQIAPAVAAIVRKANDPLRAIPLDTMAPELRAGYDHAQKERLAFLADTSYSYQRLNAEMLPALKEADTLAKAGKAKDALARIDQLSSVRPVADIPVVNIQAMELALYGASDQREEMLAIRPYVYGILQSLAHSGDAQSPLSAVHVLTSSEEYFWIGAKQLKLKQQQPPNKLDGRIYDVLTCTDADGKDHDYFFDITEALARQAADPKSLN